MLLSHGANVNAEDDKGYTPLFYAASNCCLEILIELLDRGHANVNHKANRNGKTALSKAHNSETVMLLIKYGAKLLEVYQILKNVWHINVYLLQKPF